MDYAEMTYEKILSRCLARVTSNVDRREGSVIYDAIAPAAAELAKLYSILSTEMDRAFPDTAADLDLTNKAKERGVFRLPATQAVREAAFTGSNGNFDVPIGARFSGGAGNFAVSKRRSPGVFELTAEKPGVAGNAYFGALIPIDYVPGLATATLGDVLIPGEDEEDDETLRARYLASLESTSFGGNQAQYKEQVKSIAGVGLVKVFPTFAGAYKPSDLTPPAGAFGWLDGVAGIPAEVKAWLVTVLDATTAGVVTVGGGTVRLVIVDSTGGVASDALVHAVQSRIDPQVNCGEGMGLAPIGHVVTVVAAAEKMIDLSFSLSLAAGTTWENISATVSEMIQRYFDGLIQGWEDTDQLIVRVSQIESRILDIPGVLDITGTALNNVAENLVLMAEEIPMLGTVTNDAA